jgi:hypothetical protein
MVEGQITSGLAAVDPWVVAQDIVRGKLVRTLLLRKRLHNEPLDTVEVVGFGEMLQEPYDRVFISEVIIFG